MNSDFGPLLIGLAAVGLLLVSIGIIRATWPLVARFGMWLGQRQSGSPGNWATSQELVDRPRAPSDAQTEPSGPAAKADAGVGRPNIDQQGSFAVIEEAEEHKTQELIVADERDSEGLRRESEAEAERITEDARRQAQELLEEAELEAQRIVVVAGQERARRENELEQERASLEEARTRLDSLAAIAKAAELRAQKLIVVAERDSEGLRRASEAEAERITDDARRQAKELLEEAELEAERIVDAADRERAGLVNELAQERSVLEETRTMLSGFLTDVLEEVEGPPASNEGSAAVRDLDEALAVRTSDGADH